MKHFLRHIFLVASIVMMAGAQTAYAQNTKKQENRKAQLQKEIAIIDKQLKDNEKKSRSALSDLTLKQQKVKMRRELVRESEREIGNLNAGIAERQQSIDKLQARVDTLSLYYARLVRSAYKSRDARSWYMYILASENIGQAFRRYGYFKSLSMTMKDQARELRAAQDTLELEKQKLYELKSEAEGLRQERKNELTKLQKEENESAAVVAQLKKDKKKYTSEIEAKRKKVAEIDREIARIIAQAMKGSGKKAPEIDYTLASEFSKNKGILPWPVDGTVVEGYGQHYHPVFTSVKLPFNKGVNIASAHDAAVKSVFDGVVYKIIVLPSYNVCVLVQHGNYFSFYCKLRQASVKVGDRVKTGQVLGSVDTIGGETELHFEIWKEQTHQDPENWLRPR